jgi:hypothetical protein
MQYKNDTSVQHAHREGFDDRSSLPKICGSYTFMPKPSGNKEQM